MMSEAGVSSIKPDSDRESQRITRNARDENFEAFSDSSGQSFAKKHNEARRKKKSKPVDRFGFELKLGFNSVYSPEEKALAIDKALGNIMNSHVSIKFAGLIKISKEETSMLHYTVQLDSKVKIALKAGNIDDEMKLSIEKSI